MSILDEIIAKTHKEDLNFNMNFRMDKKKKKRLEKIAESKDKLNTSKIIRFLINSFLEEFKESEEAL